MGIISRLAMWGLGLLAVVAVVFIGGCRMLTIS